jgi:iron complex transport system substrate-binding protein
MKKNIISRFLLLLLALALILGCTACSVDDSIASTTTTMLLEEEDTQTESTQIQLTDQAGREVILDEPADSIVSCYYITTYAAIALGVSDRIVGLEKKADTRPIYQMAAPELLELPQVGTMKELDVEATAALSPDLVIMPKNLIDYADTLTDLGIPVLVVNPESHEALVEMLQLMGTALGVEKQADSLTSYYETQLAKISEYTQDVEKPVVYMGSNSSYLQTAPATMYQSTLIDLAGGINAAGELEGDYWTEVSYEDILAMAPQVIVIPSGAEYTAADIMADPQLSAVPAVANGAVYQMPSGIEEWDSPIPSGILGTMWLTSILHPEVYSFEQFVTDAQDFYLTFYGFEIDSTLITK